MFTVPILITVLDTVEVTPFFQFFFVKHPLPVYNVNYPIDTLQCKPPMASLQCKPPIASLQCKLCYVNVNTNLYSALGGTRSSYQLRFTIAAAKANHHSVSHQYEREPPLSQINSLGSIQVRITFCAVYLVTIALIAATHIHTFTHGR